MKTAVVVGRFQIDILHEGHQNLIRAAYENCDRVIILIGTRIVRSESDPLPFHMVSQVVKGVSAATEVHELKDCKSDEQWVSNLKSKIEELTSEEDEVFYYGSRDSFLSTISDHKNIVELHQEVEISSTEVRNSINYENNRMFRRGYIKAIQDEFPAHFAVVDAIVTDGVNILLGKKESGFCIIGGFADSCDSNLEEAVIREVKEETNLDITDPIYLMSAQCKDWRYTRYRQPFTSVYVSKVDSFEGAEAGDDLNDIVVVPLTTALELLTGHHLTYVKKYLEWAH